MTFSGSNVAIVLGAVLLLCVATGVPRRWRPALCLVALVGFVLLCRPEPSVLRAGAMGLVGLAALTTSRRRASLPALATAVIVLLCYDPWLARSYGFALSTLATLGLILFARPWGEAIGARLPRRIRRLGDAIAIPLAAQVVCGPVIVLMQGSVSTVAVLANLLATPLVAPTTLAGIGAAVAAPLWLPLGMGIAWVGAIPAWLIGAIARACAQVPYGSVVWIEGATGAWVLALLTVAILLAGPWLRHRVSAYPARSLVALALLASLLAPWPGTASWPPPRWLVVACDVGQGDAFLVRAGPNSAVMVDVGPDPELASQCLHRHSVDHVEALVLSHFHADHVRGLPGVLEVATVDAAYVSPVDEPAQEAADTRAALAAASIPVVNATAGDQWVWGSAGQIRAHALWPARRISGGSVPNNASVVVDLQVAGTRALFTGDIEGPAARAVRARLVERAGSPVDVLKVAHHGSADQDEDLLAILRPRVALIGVGQENTFGHPAPETLDVLGRLGTRVLRTDRDGDLAVWLGADDSLRVDHSSR